MGTVDEPRGTRAGAHTLRAPHPFPRRAWAHARRTAASALLGLALACTSTSQSQPAGAEVALITRTRAVQGWQVRDDGRLAGSLLLYSDPERPRVGYYSVRNPEGQVLGLVDFEGRAWRYRLHHEQPDWLGTGTVLEGVRRILETSALAELESAPIESLVRGE